MHNIDSGNDWVPSQQHAITNVDFMYLLASISWNLYCIQQNELILIPLMSQMHPGLLSINCWWCIENIHVWNKVFLEMIVFVREIMGWKLIT